MQLDQIHIRKASANDAQTIREMMLGFYRYHDMLNKGAPPFVRELYHFQDTPEERNRLINELKGNLQDQEICVYIASYARPPEPVGYAFSRITEGDSNGFITQVYVVDAYRGRGIGTELIRCSAMEMMARGVSRVFVDVDIRNLGAQNLYERLGFTPFSVKMGVSLSDLYQNLDI